MKRSIVLILIFMSKINFSQDIDLTVGYSLWKEVKISSYFNLNNDNMLGVSIGYTFRTQGAEDWESLIAFDGGWKDGERYFLDLERNDWNRSGFGISTHYIFETFNIEAQIISVEYRNIKSQLYRYRDFNDSPQDLYEEFKDRYEKLYIFYGFTSLMGDYHFNLTAQIGIRGKKTIRNYSTEGTFIDRVKSTRTQTYYGISPALRIVFEYKLF